MAHRKSMSTMQKFIAILMFLHSSLVLISMEILPIFQLYSTSKCGINILIVFEPSSLPDKVLLMHSSLSHLFTAVEKKHSIDAVFDALVFGAHIFMKAEPIRS